MDTGKILLYGGAAVLGYSLLFPKAPAVPGTPSNSLLSSILSPGAVGIPTTYGINSGVKGGNGSFYLASNYAALVAANPNLGNSNYTMSPAENSQYLSNYQDLQTALPGWVNTTIFGVKIGSLQQAAQMHWHMYALSDKRIFVPLTPPSTAAYIPAPANPKSSGGGSFWSSALSTVASVAIAVLGTNTPEPKLNDKDLELLFTAGYVVFDILPLYKDVAPELVGAINDKYTEILTQYS